MTQTPAERRFIRLTASINSKAAKLGLVGRIRATDLALIYLMHKDTGCPYCGIGLDPLHCSFDHVIPFIRGGPNEMGNIVACCMTCQRAKGTKLTDEYHEARRLMAECETCGRQFKPRWADWVRGYGRTCSRSCSGTKGGRATGSARS